MGRAIDFTERNDFLGKPENMTENQCYALPVARIATYVPGEDETKPAVQVHAHISEWQLTDEEKEEVARTGKVYLKVIGMTTFPVSVHGIKPIYLGDGDLCDKLYTKEEVKDMHKKN
jgi:hypothetical protein